MSPVRKITRESLKRAPLDELPRHDRAYAAYLIELADKRPWSEIELRKAAELEVKAWAISKDEWLFTPAEAKEHYQRRKRR
jgi:hypothetical protein